MLQLVARVVANDWRRVFVTREINLAHAITNGPVQGIKHPWPMFTQAAQQPGEGSLGFRLCADAQKRFDGVAGVAYPGEAVIVVFAATNPLGKG